MPRIRTAFLGTGGIAGKHANTLFKHAEVQIVAGCDVSDAAVNGFLDRVLPKDAPRPAVFTDAAQMYAQAKPDAVVICTPHTLHFDQGIQALNAGCHVLMEKPMVTSVDHAYQLADKVKQVGKIFAVAYNTPCTPEFNYLRNCIRTNRLGKLQLVCGYISQNWRNLTIGLWRQKPELSGGGMAYDSGAHLLNSVVWAVESPVASVFAQIDNCNTPVDINSALNIRFQNGVMAALAIGGNTSMGGTFCTFMFEQGRIDIDGWSGTWMQVYENERQIKYPPVPGEPTDPAANFIDAILGRAEPCTTPRNGIQHSELMDAIYQSARTGLPAAPPQR
jgi:predicted dehydrogenase